MNKDSNNLSSISSRNARYAIYCKVRNNIMEGIYDVNLPFMQTATQIRPTLEPSLIRAFRLGRTMPTFFGKNSGLMKLGRNIRSRITGPQTADDILQRMQNPTKMDKIFGSIRRGIIAGHNPILGAIRKIGVKAMLTPGIGIPSKRGNVPSLNITGADVIKGGMALGRMGRNIQGNLQNLPSGEFKTTSQYDPTRAFSSSHQAKLLAKAAEEANAVIAGSGADVSKLSKEEQRHAATKLLNARNILQKVNTEVDSGSNPYLKNYLVRHPLSRDLIPMSRYLTNVKFPT